MNDSQLSFDVMSGKTEIRSLISAKRLKVTPQRVSVLKAVYSLGNHPTEENIFEYIRNVEPDISHGTVYKVLDTLVANNLIKKVETDKGIMRYDGVMEKHHHLHCRQSDRIEDYHNGRLDRLLSDFFRENSIDNFIIEDIKLHISGSFVEQEKQ